MTAPTTVPESEGVLARARAIIAREMLEAENVPAVVGQITLHAHQRRAVARVRALLRMHGGALLADATGLGKTFVALAVASTVERTLIIMPASLRETWIRAAALASMAPSFISLEQLSRGAASPVREPELVVVDEAHHLRNPLAKRYGAVAALCDRARVLLLSATPLQNRRDDLVAQLALFLGDAALSATDNELAQYLVRRRSSEMATHVPAVRGPTWIRLPVNDDVLDELVALPPPTPAADEGEAGALVSYTLLRQWASSRAALVAALRRRLAKALALIACLEAGRWPTRDAIAAWSQTECSMQLAMPELLTPLGDDATFDLLALLAAVRAHAESVRAMLATLRVRPDPDPFRAAALADICRRHSGRRVLAFSQYAETVTALSRLLMASGHAVAELTARGGRVAGGRLRRREVLAQFTPSISDAEPPAAERIGLLVTTDVLSEGLDLQRASVVVHIDLPWNPARLEQRVGRVRRLGSRHEAVYVYALAPPASSERVLRVEARLRAKLQLAERIVGLDDANLPTATSVAESAPELTSAMLAQLERWRDASASDEDSGGGGSRELVCAAVRAPNDGFLALVAVGAHRLLLARLDEQAVTQDPAAVSLAARLCAGPAIPVSAPDAHKALEQIEHWGCGHSARCRLAMPSPRGASVRRHVATRVASLLSTSPRHERATVAALASRARDVLAVPLGAGGERALEALANADVSAVEWLGALVRLGDGRRPHHALATAAVPIAVILLRREATESKC